MPAQPQAQYQLSDVRRLATVLKSKSRDEEEHGKNWNVILSTRVFKQSTKLP